MPFYTLRPNGDEKADWDEVPSGTAWEQLYDPVTQPTAPDTATRIETTTKDEGSRVELETFAVPDMEAVVKATAWFYLKAGSTITVDYEIQGRATTTGYVDTSYSWVSVSYSGGLSQQALDGLRIGVIARGTTGGTAAECAAMYLEAETAYVALDHGRVGPSVGLG